MKICFWLDPIEAGVISGKQRFTSVVATSCGYSATNREFALSATRRNEAANQILDGNDPAKVVLSIDDSRQTESRTAQLLHDAIGGLIVGSYYNAPYIFAQRFVSVSFEQDVRNIDQPGRLAVGRKDRQAIKTGRGTKLKRFLC